MIGPLAHLSEEQLKAFGREVDQIRDATMSRRGKDDADYIHGVIRLQRGMVAVARLLIYLSLLFLPGVVPQLANGLVFGLTIGLGSFLLGCGKILENMELGHNIMHGQWDWMRDPDINSTTWEWDTISVSDHWKETHNVHHHTWTNVIGKDDDIGYGVLRILPEQAWRPGHLLQPIGNLLLCLFFEWGNALQILDIPSLVRGQKSYAAARPQLQAIGRKMRRQFLKDYVGYPLLAGPFFLYVAAANAVAGVIRNVWSNMIIFCGHFPGGVHTFHAEDCEHESRGHWYARQLLGSCNIEGGRLFHLMSGQLSFQIEHHLFPDMPSQRLREVAPAIRALAARYGLAYNTAPLWRQYGTTTLRIWRMALPNGFFANDKAA